MDKNIGEPHNLARYIYLKINYQKNDVRITVKVCYTHYTLASTVKRCCCFFAKMTSLRADV